MLLDIGMIALGLLGLFFGGEWLVRGAARLATALGVPTLIIGLTIVALGTSAPELLVALVAAYNGTSDIAVGNVIGSNIANIGLILGVAGLIAPLRIDAHLIRREIPLMIGFSLLVILMAADGEIGRHEGLALLAGYVAFTYGLYRFAPKEDTGEREVIAEVMQIEGQPTAVQPLREFLWVAGGLIVLAVGAQLTVEGAVNVARVVGISEIVIGLTLVAVGTSLPEIVTVIIAAWHKHDDLAAGNVIGSNISNLLVILGFTALVLPIRVDGGLMAFEFPIMLAFAIVPIPLMLNYRLARWQAAALLAAYVAFILFTLVNR